MHTFKARHLGMVAVMTWLVAAVAVRAQGTETNAPVAETKPAIGNINPAEVDKLNSTYLLVPGDKIRFRVEQDPKPAPDRAELLVNGLGFVDFPVSQGYNVVVQLPVSGKTINQVKQEITRKLNEKYYYDCQVNLVLINQNVRPGFVLFFGAAQGKVALEPGNPKTLSQALIELGWSEFANLRKVKVQRVDPTTGKSTEVEVNVYDVLNKNKREDDLQLMDGDRVSVPERSFVF